MTKATNFEQQKDLEKTVEKIWKTLDRDYFMKDEVDRKIDDLQTDLSTNYCLISSHVSLEEKMRNKFSELDQRLHKIKEEQDDQKDSITDIDRRMILKADNDSVKRVKMDLKRFALYDDFKDLYSKTMQPMQVFQDQMHTYSNEHG